MHAPPGDDVDVGACLSGDALAWEQFVARFTRVIYTAVRRTCDRGSARIDRGDLEDLVQEVFVKLVKNDFATLRTYRPERASLVTWLTVVARSVAVDFLRRHRAPGPALVEQSEADAIIEPKERVEVPRNLLSSRQRLVLHLLYDRDMEVSEVAGVLGVNVQTVRSTKHKAILKLRQCFRDE